MAVTFTSVMPMGLPAQTVSQMDVVRNQDMDLMMTSITATVQSNVTAVGTTLSASTTALTADVCLIGSCSKDSNDSVSLRAWSGFGNRTQVVINRSGSLCQVWPPVGGFIGTSATGAYYATGCAFSLANLATAEFFAVNTKEFWPQRTTT